MLDRYNFDNKKIIKDTDSIKEIISYDPYENIDKICNMLNRIKYALLEKTSFAGLGCVVESSEKTPIIGTVALDTCYGILFYDRENKYGLVGHGLPSGKLRTLHKMINKINEGTEKVIEYIIVPGFRNVDRRDMSGLDELLDELEKLCPSNIKFVPLQTSKSDIKLDNRTLSYEFAFDTEIGEFVSSSIFFDECEVNPRFIRSGHRGFK